jgi:5-methylcytosine-specific restriction endonuclease McrA
MTIVFPWPAQVFSPIIHLAKIRSTRKPKSVRHTTSDMGKMTPSQAKNAIRRALAGVLDPHPSSSQVQQIWGFFDSSCAYCGQSLTRGTRDAHIDHLVSASAGGSNELGNFVLSCSICNGDEKREAPWEGFLRKKAVDDATFISRKDRIERWMSRCEAAIIVDAELRAALDEEIEHAISAFDRALQRVRRLKNGTQNRQAKVRSPKDLLNDIS